MPLCPRRDHARGNEELVRLCPGLRVSGADERIGALTHRVAPDEELTVCGALNGEGGGSEPIPCPALISVPTVRGHPCAVPLHPVPH